MFSRVLKVSREHYLRFLKIIPLLYCDAVPSNYKVVQFLLLQGRSLILGKPYVFDIHVSVHHDIIYENDQEEATV